jgi:hypothetical protein
MSSRLRSSVATGAACLLTALAFAPVAAAHPAKPPTASTITPLSAKAAAAATALPHFFAANSIWNSPVPATAPRDLNSGAIVGNLLQQQATEGMDIATTSYGVPIYQAAADQPLVNVTLLQGPAQFVLKAAFAAVPLPAGAQAAAGTDANLAVYQASTDSMWEFWRLADTPTGWTAQGGGKLYGVSQSSGYYENLVDTSGNVLEQPNWGPTASSLALTGGVMTISELESGRINHALALGITHTAAGYFAAPAERTDGDSTDPTAVPEGAHFVLDPTLNLSTLHLPHFTLMMAEAAQKYGIIINNRSTGFTFRAQDPGEFMSQYGYNPFMGPANAPGSPGALFDQWPSAILAAFPWSHLELLQMSVQTQPDNTQYVLPPSEGSMRGMAALPRMR